VYVRNFIIASVSSDFMALYKCGYYYYYRHRRRRRRRRHHHHHSSLLKIATGYD